MYSLVNFCLADIAYLEGFFTIPVMIVRDVAVIAVFETDFRTLANRIFPVILKVI